MSWNRESDRARGPNGFKHQPQCRLGTSGNGSVDGFLRRCSSLASSRGGLLAGSRPSRSALSQAV